MAKKTDSLARIESSVSHPGTAPTNTTCELTERGGAAGAGADRADVGEKEKRRIKRNRSQRQRGEKKSDTPYGRRSVTETEP